jgi:hypothetical protein
VAIFVAHIGATSALHASAQTRALLHVMQSPANIDVDASECNVDDHLTLAQAARAIPGKPSCCAVWRWCRRGVKSRSGNRVHLQHIRIGGKIFTKAAWVRDFGRRLAEADVAHFDCGEGNGDSPNTAAKEIRQQHQEAIDRELREAGM